MTTVCRVCLMEGSDFAPLFNDTGNGVLSEKVMFCATVEILPNDKLPANICMACMDKLDISYNFRRQCEAADCWLRENLALINIKNEETDKEMRKRKKKSSEKPEKRKSARITAKKHSQPEEVNNEVDSVNENNIILDIKEEDDVKIELEIAENSASQDGDNDLKYEDIVDFVNDNENDSDYFGDKELSKKRKRAKKKDKRDKKKKKRGRKAKVYYDEYGDITLEKPPIRYCCEHCGKYFTSGSYLKVHSRIHLGIKAFECGTCGKKFSTRDYLRKHSRTHSDVKLYKCAYCPKGFNDWGSRQKHERIHRKERPYVCDICGKRFTYSYTMTKHKLTHSGLKMFSCEICKRNFTMKYHLKSHQMRVHKDLMAIQALASTPKTDNATTQNTTTLSVQNPTPDDASPSIVSPVPANGLSIENSPLVASPGEDSLLRVEFNQMTDQKPLISQSDQDSQEVPLN